MKNGTGNSNAHRLPIVSDPLPGDVAGKDMALRTGLSDADIESALADFAQEEAKRLGLKVETQHWVDQMVNPTFTASQRKDTTLLVSGLTAAHDYLVRGALRGLGYNVEVIDVPDNEALRYGKEFGNRGQCNPTYFTVGNLVKYLTERCEKDGLTPQQVVEKFVFLTAGACGPCRFGMYATEYRKALRDAGFDGFRVVLFQQTGGLKQATGEEAGLVMNPPFFIGLLKALVAGDVINGMGYRMRPFEAEVGATDKAIAKAKDLVHAALVNKTNILWALLKARREFARIKTDYTRPLPRVSIIGEFWAMTTEGDGNYQLQRFLESEGAECDIQFITNWLLYMLWEGKYDTRVRADLKQLDQGSKRSVEDPQVGKKLAALFLADAAVRSIFHVFGACIGFHNYHLPDMDVIAETAHQHYNNMLRGGEGHMEVGKFILNVLHNKSHMTLSVKPFGCMPSSGVSDGVQSLITTRYPNSIFCAIETSGDGKVNVQSRVQMFLFKARQAAQKEYDELCQKFGITREALAEFFAKHPQYGSGLYRSPHGGAGTAADRLVEFAPYVGKPDWQVPLLRTVEHGRRFLNGVAAVPGKLAVLRRRLVEKSPVLWAQAREEWQEARPALAEKLRQRARDARAGVDATLARVGFGTPATSDDGERLSA